MPRSRRNLRAERSLGRRSNIKDVKITIYVFCEGKNTEPDFIDEFNRMHGNRNVMIFPEKAAGAPVTIVDSASAKKKALDKHAKKTKDSLDTKFQVWALFDRDEHPNIDRAMNKAAGNNVKVGFSNPCFELWPVLHLEECNANIHRHDLQARLKQICPEYDPKSGKSVSPRVLEADGDYELAKTRATRLAERHEEVGSDKANPYTDVYVLFDLIKEHGSEK